ncbi:phosphoenolpyruvate carboxykinase (ATP) [Hansschlegelia plantiphila]|uniref:Phosphoenolpyruvate carboxykinase (ATP) n=1 Tax=Hansschlegelia plantiphila TaxID=374655 RepID=A0A9W6MUU6_9HYPH|nr:phosphoenolpyruvate carboxykinase (ATP) [Hansschlegelia plantiphila]GLK67302.1 phosphoenolpyruvate carboxykinase [ATP] [Hansschlegelia plantiphila]
MRQTGVWNETHGAEAFGFEGLAGVSWNLCEAALVERAVRRGEAALSATGALVAETGGSLVRDTLVVRDETTEATVPWHANAAISPEAFEALLLDFLGHAAGKELFAQDLHVGAGMPTRVFCEHAWRAMAVRTILSRPGRAELADFAPALTVLDLPSFRIDRERHGVRSGAVIAIDVARRIVLVGGACPAAAITDAAFFVLGHVAAEDGALPFRAAANVGPDGKVALFLGRAGAGKTTLVADPGRAFAGDGGFVWDASGLSIVDAGLSGATEGAAPDVLSAASGFGAVLENVALDGDSRAIDFGDAARAGRGRYVFPRPASAYAGAQLGHPSDIVMLVSDAFGVMPPIARLTAAQAHYQFLSGYAQDAGSTEPKADFSPGFGGAPACRDAAVYGEAFRNLLDGREVRCWLVNTGWHGGARGTGRRVSLDATRALVAAALAGSLDGVETYTNKLFGFEMPIDVPGLDPLLFRPRKAWGDKRAYLAAARKLREQFQANFAKYEPETVVGAAETSAADDEFREAAE